MSEKNIQRDFEPVYRMKLCCVGKRSLTSRRVFLPKTCALRLTNAAVDFTENDPRFTVVGSFVSSTCPGQSDTFKDILSFSSPLVCAFLLPLITLFFHPVFPLSPDCSKIDINIQAFLNPFPRHF